MQDPTFMTKIQTLKHHSNIRFDVSWRQSQRSVFDNNLQVCLHVLKDLLFATGVRNQYNICAVIAVAKSAFSAAGRRLTPTRLRFRLWGNTSRSCTIWGPCSSFNSLISLKAVTLTPSFALPSLIFLIATTLPVCRNALCHTGHQRQQPAVSQQNSTSL